jgi:hypothetical protein
MVERLPREREVALQRRLLAWSVNLKKIKLLQVLTIYFV